MPAQVFCPSCWAQVPADSPRCPKCGKGVNDYPTRKPAPPPLPASTRPVPRPRSRDSEDDDRPRRRRSDDDDDRQANRGGSAGVIIGLVAAGGILFLALAAGVIYVLLPKSKPVPAAVATAPEPEIQPLNTPIRP